MRLRLTAAVSLKDALELSSNRRANPGSTCKLNRRTRAMSSDLSKTIDRVLADSRSDETDVRTATAPHQHDFPYDREEEAQVTRREFCNFLGLTSAALFAGAAGFAGKAVFDESRTPQFPPSKIEGAETLAPGSSLNFQYPT